MKIKDGFILRQIAGSWIVVPIGERVVTFNGLITLSDSGALLWNELERGTDTDKLLEAITDEYDVDEITAKADIQEFITAVHGKGLLE